MSERTPNFVLTSSVSVTSGYNSKTLEAGSFIRPISLQYVPQHILENSKNTYFDKDLEVYVYTRYGILRIPKNLMREV